MTYLGRGLRPKVPPSCGWYIMTIMTIKKKKKKQRNNFEGILLLFVI